MALSREGQAALDQLKARQMGVAPVENPPSTLQATPRQDAPAPVRGQIVDGSHPRSLDDPHLRGRRLVSFQEAQQTADSDLEEWDNGLNWGGLIIPSYVAPTHFCVVGAPGSGKTMLLRLLMQSVMPLIGQGKKTKDVVHVIELDLDQEKIEESQETEPKKLSSNEPRVEDEDTKAILFGGLILLGMSAALYLAYPGKIASGDSDFLWVCLLLAIFGVSLICSYLGAIFKATGQQNYSGPKELERAIQTQSEPEIVKQEEKPTRTEIIKGPQWEGHRAIVYDAKQDILSILHGMDGIRCPIYTLNPFDERCAAWDMAADITAPATAQQIATILIPESKNASQPFFTDAARHLLTGVFIALMRKSGKNWEFRDVVLALKSRKNLALLLEDVPETQDLLEQYLPHDESGRNVTAQNIMSSVATKMAPFEFVAAAWGQAKTKVSLRGWLASEYILVLGNDEAHRAALDAINRVLFKRMTELILSQPETTTGRTWIFLDEAREAGDLDGLGRLMTKGRSKGACVVLGFQDIEGMREAYGEKMAHEIVGMCANKAILRVESPETAKWASEVFGEFEAFEDKQGWSKGEALTTGEATTKGTATTQGNSITKSKGSSSGGSVFSSNSSKAKSENFSESSNQSESKNSSQSKNWNESLNRERVQRAALLPSQFLSLPATNPRTGLTGFFVSPYIGAYEAWISGDALKEQLHEPDSGFPNIEHRNEDHQYLTPWKDRDYTRLKLKRAPVAAPPSNAASSNNQVEPDNKPPSVEPEPQSTEALPDAQLPTNMRSSRKKARKISQIDTSDFRATFGIE